MLQNVAALLSLGLALIVVAVALFVARRATTADATGQTAVYRIRRPYAVALIVTLLATLLLTLRHTPYADRSGETPARTIEALGWMWSWEFRENGETVSLPLVVAPNELIEFAVTSTDVNHGFGIYDPDGRLVSQVQALPGYVHHLRHRFERTGSYRILCLEYCGVGHPVMLGEIAVR